MTVRHDPIAGGGGGGILDQLPVFAGELRVRVTTSGSDEPLELVRWSLRRLGGTGLLGLTVPSALGGAGLGVTAAIARAEALAAAGVPVVARAVEVHAGFVVPLLVRTGSPAQVERWLPGLLAGTDVAAIAIAEPGAGAELPALGTTATRDGDGWRLDGHKTSVVSGEVADVFLLAVRTGRPGGGAGMSLLLVDRTAPGLGVRPTGHGDGTAHLTLDDVHVGAEAVLGEPGQAFVQLMGGLELERLAAAAGLLADAQRLLDLTVVHAQGRELLGRRVASFTATKHKVAELQTTVDAARALLHTTAARIEAGERPTRELAGATVFASRAHLQVSEALRQVQNGLGYLAEPTDSRLADAPLARIGIAPDAVLLEYIAKTMGV